VPSAKLPTPLKTQVKIGHGSRVGAAGSSHKKSHKKKPPGPEKVVRTVSPLENPEELKECCHVCWDGESFEENPILYCEVCDMAVHQICYGIATIPEVGSARYAPRGTRHASPSPLQLALTPHDPCWRQSRSKSSVTRTRSLFTKASSALRLTTLRTEIIFTIPNMHRVTHGMTRIWI
jgi:hypothetical protein